MLNWQCSYTNELDEQIRMSKTLWSKITHEKFTSHQSVVDLQQAALREQDGYIIPV